MISFYSRLLLSFALSGAVFGVPCRATTVTASMPQSVYRVGASIPLDISISNVSDLYAYQFDLSFDPSVLFAQSVTEDGYFLSNGISFSAGTINNTSGSISFVADSLSGPGPGFTGDTLLATVTFEAVAPGLTTVTPDNLTLLNSNLSDITTGITSAAVEVSGTTATPEPPSLGLLSGLFCVGLTRFTRQLRSAQTASYKTHSKTYSNLIGGLS